MFSPCQTCCKRISQSHSAVTGPIVSTRAGLVPRWYQKKKRQKETENHRSKRQQGRRRLWVIRWRSRTECGWRAFIRRSERFMFIRGCSYTNQWHLHGPAVDRHLPNMQGFCRFLWCVVWDKRWRLFERRNRPKMETWRVMLASCKTRKPRPHSQCLYRCHCLCPRAKIQKYIPHLISGFV